MEDLKLLQVLENYPTLKGLFEKEWFLKEFSKEEENRHVLIELLLREEPKSEHVKGLLKDLDGSLRKGRLNDAISIYLQINELLYLTWILKNLEIRLDRLNGVKGFRRIIEELRESYDPIEFLYVISKVEIASRFTEKFDEIEFEGQIRRYQADLKVKLKDRDITFDFVTPNELNDFIKSKVQLFKENSPLVPIIEISYSKIYGSKMKQVYDIKKISCFVVFNVVALYGRPIYIGFLIENPKAENRLLKDEIDILCKSLRLFRFPTTELIQVFSQKSVQEKLKKGGFRDAQRLLQRIFAQHLGDWIKSLEDVFLLFLQLMNFISRKSDKYEYRCLTLSSWLHLSALKVNTENWWKKLTRLGESISFLQDGIAQVQNLEMILLSKRKSSEEMKISLLLPIYQSIVEGIFQSMARIIVTEINIITGKSSKHISTTGIPKLVQEINSFNSGELKVLTKGYSQTLRNAISHGTCKVEISKKMIIAVDREKEEIITFSKLKKMKRRLEQASYMVAFSLIATFFNLALIQENQRRYNA